MNNMSMSLDLFLSAIRVVEHMRRIPYRWLRGQKSCLILDNAENEANLLKLCQANLLTGQQNDESYYAQTKNSTSLSTQGFHLPKLQNC